MSKEEEKKNKNKAEEPQANYQKTIKIFTSFEEQELYLINEMAALTSTEILKHLRKLINVAYGMHGYNPDNLPKQHQIKNIRYIKQ